MRTTTRLTLPAGGACRLFVVPPGFLVVVADTPEGATTEALTRRGHASALLTHDAGMTWPDRRGEALAAAALAEGWTVALQFAALADAMACARRLEAGPA
jgi:hypothetical protein